ncbi:3-keto-5-aminohexanoate cleavage protein [Hyphomicrobium sp. CS1BSMeth3]|uniref:3-keto-5-aminohexanoate cleavage protein n=1 Tax=Hyphomicrobium sp. CS1BSMeth3 TaxID=1892844 RepID=UPI000931D183|nr:3-keto-5-aminohexanoate cleavage protein [Hyphomicrobium sp. CS1BSMeth3]
MKPTILTCAVTGTFPTRAHNPALPVTPQEIADSCIGAAKAGAAICHIHVRDPQSGVPSMKLEYYREVMQRIRASGTDLIINLTTGPGGRFIPSDDEPAKAAPGTLLTTPEIRTEHVVELKPEICTLDLNTMWFGGGAVINTPRNLRVMAERMYAAGVKPEIEAFDTGDLVMAQDLIADGTIKLPALFQIVTGVKYGMPSTPETMQLAKSLLPKDCEWAAFGAGRHAFTMLAQAFILGGHCRIGMEDTVHLSRGVPAPSNAALVEKGVTIIENLGGKIATVEEARSILQLKPRKA